MTKRIAFIFLWTIGLMLGSAVLITLAIGFYFFTSAILAYPPTDERISWIGKSAGLVPTGLAGLGLLLGVWGVLPGTRRTVSNMRL